MKRLAVFAAQSCEDKKADDVRLLDMAKVSGIADYAVLATVGSTAQMEAVGDHLKESLWKQGGVKALHRDGAGYSPWRVWDYGGLVVHVMLPATRAFYALERLWAGARRVDWKTKKRRKKK